MPFGFFEVEEKETRPKKIKERAPQKEVKTTPRPKNPAALASDVKSLQIHILLIGRNLSILQEFLCSMNQNMSETLQDMGMAYYTRELASISDIVAQKKRLEQFFWTFSADNWTYPQDERVEKTYVFSISPSGDQAKSLDFTFHCVTAQSEKSLIQQKMDAVWMVSDGGLFCDGAFADPYYRFLRDTLSEIEPGKVAPICMLLAQIEGEGHFDGLGRRSSLPAEVEERLLSRCREIFASQKMETPVDLIPVQVYGGMECVGMDEKCDPLLRICSSGFYQSYIPDNCQIPGLYTLQKIAAQKGADFFADAPSGGLLSGIKRYYGKKFGNAGWTPKLLWDKGEV